MGNDSGIKRKHKQRTTVHKKHQAFPGMKLSPEVTIQHGSIRPINKPNLNLSKDTPTKKRTDNVELWDKYDKAAKTLGVNASSSTLQMRNNIEFEYLQLYRKLVKLGQLPRIKKKYTK